ncbi:helix-turn-helix transcriptional regulator [Pontibaca methylaminivorans]|uniref:helix-turn-helix transcriptional regulator n=1 Tax=Pontibaca methylaminivorans TaxID=515897 RepID=UPI001F3C0D0C|nr:helix-turn-helix transcriptional regulator [Pontibaca methylaminivorans]
MIEELARHGYRVSAGTLYPMLHAMERNGYLESERSGPGARIAASTERRPMESRR